MSFIDSINALIGASSTSKSNLPAGSPLSSSDLSLVNDLAATLKSARTSGKGGHTHKGVKKLEKELEELNEMLANAISPSDSTDPTTDDSTTQTSSAVPAAGAGKPDFGQMMSSILQDMDASSSNSTGSK
jgi:hypothetical protein